MSKDEKGNEPKTQDLGTLNDNPTVKRKPKKTKMDGGTVRTDY